MGQDLVSRYVAHRIREWLKEDAGRKQADLARAAGVSPAHISNLLEGTRGAGAKTLRGIASALGTTWPELEAAATEWARARETARPAGPGLTADELRTLLSLAKRCTLSQIGELLEALGAALRSPIVSSGKETG